MKPVHAMKFYCVRVVVDAARVVHGPIQRSALHVFCCVVLVLLNTFTFVYKSDIFNVTSSHGSYGRLCR